MSRKILITRPEPEASALAAHLSGLGYESVVEPMLDIQKMGSAPQGVFECTGYVFTSANALRFLSPEQVDLDKPVFCVGEKTEAAARGFGFKNVQASALDVGGLADILKSQKGTYIHYRGVYVSRSLTGLVAGAEGLNIQEQIIYTSIQKDRFSDKGLKNIDNNEISSVLFYSKRTAEAFVKAVGFHNCTPSFETIRALCLADSMVECLSVLPWKDMKVASAPTQKAMIEALQNMEQE